MTVRNGEDANEYNFNKGLASKTASNTFVGIQTLDNAGSNKIVDLQKAINTIFEIVGGSELALNNGDYENNNFVADGDSRKVAISKLDGALKALSDSVASIQAPIFTNLGTLQFSSGGTITLSETAGMMNVLVEGGTASVTASATPFGASPVIRDNALVEIIGNDDTKKVTFVYADVDGGCLLFGDQELGLGASLRLRWNATKKRFFHVR